jgi:hypothetical protein
LKFLGSDGDFVKEEYPGHILSAWGFCQGALVIPVLADILCKVKIDIHVAVCNVKV